MDLLGDAGEAVAHPVLELAEVLWGGLRVRTHEQPLIAAIRLDLALDMNHELVRLAASIPWDHLSREFGPPSLPRGVGGPSVTLDGRKGVFKAD